MENTKRIFMGTCLLGLILLASACNGEPREGYYDREHHRWYHEHGWRDCGEHEEHCR